MSNTSNKSNTAGVRVTLRRCDSLSRRGFLSRVGVAGGAAVAVNMGLFGWSARKVMGAPVLPGHSGDGPIIHVGFCRPGPEDIWEEGWPGLAYDAEASRALYIETLKNAALEMGIDLRVQVDYLTKADVVDSFYSDAIDEESSGVLLCVMDAHRYGLHAVDRILEQRGDNNLPVLVFAPHGTHFLPHVRRFRDTPYCFVGATPDVQWLGDALRMMKAQWQMANTRLSVVRDVEESEERLLPIGTTLRHTPMQQYLALFDAAEGAEEALDIARIYSENAKEIIEPTAEDVLEAARAYVANRRLLDETGCHAVTTDCFVPVTTKRMYTPCMAFMQLLDEGTCGGCEADIMPALTLLLSSYLLNRPGFLHNPTINTVKNLYGGAHCVAPTLMAGFDKEPEPYIMRTHHETDWGVAPQILFKDNQPATVLRFLSAGTLMVGTGTLMRNIDTHPHDGVGGCRTAFEMAMDDIPDVRDVRGHHNVLIYDKHLQTVRAWSQLAGIKAEHLIGGELT